MDGFEDGRRDGAGLADGAGTEGSRAPVARFDPMTGEPLDGGGEVVENLSDMTVVNATDVEDVASEGALDDVIEALPEGDARARPLEEVREGLAHDGPSRVGSEAEGAAHGGDPSGAPREGGSDKAGRRSAAASVLAGALGGVAASVAVVAVFVGCGVLGVGGHDGQAAVARQASATVPSEPLATGAYETVDEAVAAKCLPSVVSISVSGDAGEGIGSGVVFDGDGNVITNWHVVDGASIISVRIGTETYPATLVGGDESSDVAVVHVEAPADVLVPIEVGDSSALVVGDWVMTLGSPLGLDQSASTGIVSALYRNTAMRTNYGTNTLYTNLIQVDAAINGGNSGGALVNDAGQLVGINTLYANAAGTETFSGIGFAIPGNAAVEIARKVIAGEQITHAYVGASCATVNESNARANRLGVASGAYVSELSSGGPAEAAGMKVGDVITKIGDTPVESAEDYVLAVRSHAVGEEVDFVVRRGNEDVTLRVRMGSDEELQRQQREARDGAAQDTRQMQNAPTFDDMFGWPWDVYDLSPYGRQSPRGTNGMV